MTTLTALLAGIILISVLVGARHVRAATAPVLFLTQPKEAMTMSRATRRNAGPTSPTTPSETVMLSVAEPPPAEPPAADLPADPKAQPAAPSSYAELGERVSSMLAYAEETGAQILAEAQARADQLRAEADAYVVKRRRDAQENAARITAKAADNAHALEQTSDETRRRIEDEKARQRDLLLLCRTVEEELRRTITTGRETFDRLEAMVDELSGASEAWEDSARVQQASA